MNNVGLMSVSYACVYNEFLHLMWKSVHILGNPRDSYSGRSDVFGRKITSRAGEPLVSYKSVSIPSHWLARKKFRPNRHNISAQHIETLLGATCCAFGHPAATCCDMLGIENRTSAHAWVQHCCTNLVKRLQHHATSTIVAWKIWLFSNLSQQHPTHRNRVAKRMHHVAPNNVAIVCPGL